MKNIICNTTVLFLVTLVPWERERDTSSVTTLWGITELYIVCHYRHISYCKCQGFDRINSRAEIWHRNRIEKKNIMTYHIYWKQWTNKHWLCFLGFSQLLHWHIITVLYSYTSTSLYNTETDCQSFTISQTSPQKVCVRHMIIKWTALRQSEWFQFCLLLNYFGPRQECSETGCCCWTFTKQIANISEQPWWHEDRRMENEDRLT